MLLANYASDSDSDAGSDSESSKPAKTQVTAPPPPPGAPIASSSTKSAIAKGKKPVKITLGLPKSGAERDKELEDGNEERIADVNDDDEERASKKPKIAGGKGGSSLLGMLPPPKRKLPSSTTSKASSLKVNKSMASSSTSTSSTSKINVPKPLLASTKASTSITTGTSNLDEDDDEEEENKLLPPSLARKAQKKKDDEQLDLFGLSSNTPTPTAASSSTSSLKPTLISSAPSAPDYIPPEPTPNDPYPGYYQIPTGEWKAYDPTYYNSFFTSAQNVEEEEDDDGRIGKHWNEFNNGGYAGDLVEINAIKGVEDARKEEERRKLTERKKINENEFEYKPLGQVKGLASQRHQLTSLLNTAYTQREELEDRIAQNKKNMRMAGTKYGF